VKITDKADAEKMKKHWSGAKIKNMMQEGYHHKKCKKLQAAVQEDPNKEKGASTKGTQNSHVSTLRKFSNNKGILPQLDRRRVHLVPFGEPKKKNAATGIRTEWKLTRGRKFCSSTNRKGRRLLAYVRLS